jgi:hypothetical protein
MDWMTGLRSPAGEKDFFLVSASKPVLGTTQLGIQWVLGVLSPGVKHGQGVVLTTHPVIYLDFYVK